MCVPRQHSKCCAHGESHNEGDVLDGIDLHSSCVWIQTEVVREVEAKETAQGEHLHRLKGNSIIRMYVVLSSSMTDIPHNSLMEYVYTSLLVYTIHTDELQGSKCVV